MIYILSFLTQCSLMIEKMNYFEGLLEIDIEDVKGLILIEQ